MKTKKTIQINKTLVKILMLTIETLELEQRVDVARLERYRELLAKTLKGGV